MASVFFSDLTFNPVITVMIIQEKQMLSLGMCSAE